MISYPRSYNMLPFASSIKNDKYLKVNFRSLIKSIKCGRTSFESLSFSEYFYLWGSKF